MAESIKSAGAYEICAREFLAARDGSVVGADIVSDWARSLPGGTDVIEIACGGGLPVTRALVEAGANIWAIDSSATLLATFRSRFPAIPTRCQSALECDYFGRRFDAALAIGLMFLLEESEQIALLYRVSEILLPGGHFLFTAPSDAGTWRDIITGQECRSLGQARYVDALKRGGFHLMRTCVDSGDNHYYDARKDNG